MSNTFKYSSIGTDLRITIDDDNQAECPQCKCKFKQLLQHLRKTAECRLIINSFENFKNEYQAFGNRRKQCKYRKKKLEDDTEGTHVVEAAKKRKQRERKLENNAEETHIVEAIKERKQRDRKLESNAEETHIVEAIKERKQRERKLESNAEKCI